MYLILH